MPEAEEESDRVTRLLAGAEKVIGDVHFCWLATGGAPGRPNLRPMGRLQPEGADDPWTIRFVTDGRSSKAADIRRIRQVALVFQNDADDAFVTVAGMATLHEGPSEVSRRWKPAYDQFFPTETDRANAAFLEVEARRMELWIRGVTPEPFGLQATILERDGAGAWRLQSK